MPQKLDHCVKEIMKQGNTEDAAWGICISSLRDAGSIKYDKKNKRWVSATSREFLAARYTFREFSSEFNKVIAKEGPELESGFTSLREKYAREFKNWKARLDPSDRGFVLYIEDLDSWENAEVLSSALNRLATLYQQTIKQAAVVQKFARVVLKSYSVEC